MGAGSGGGGVRPDACLVPGFGGVLSRGLRGGPHGGRMPLNARRLNGSLRQGLGICRVKQREGACAAPVQDSLRYFVQGEPALVPSGPTVPSWENGYAGAGWRKEGGPVLC